MLVFCWTAPLRIRFSNNARNCSTLKLYKLLASLTKLKLVIKKTRQKLELSRLFLDHPQVDAKEAQKKAVDKGKKSD